MTKTVEVPVEILKDAVFWLSDSLPVEGNRTVTHNELKALIPMPTNEELIVIVEAEVRLIGHCEFVRAWSEIKKRLREIDK